MKGRAQDPPPPSRAPRRPAAAARKGGGGRCLATNVSPQATQQEGDGSAGARQTGIQGSPHRRVTETIFPPPPPTGGSLEAAQQWLPPARFLPPGMVLAPPQEWQHWDGSTNVARPPTTEERAAVAREGAPARMVADMLAEQAENRVYESVAALAWALQAQVAAAGGQPAFRPWTRVDPTHKPQVSGLLMTREGLRRVTILLDTGATHCFICHRLAAALQLPASHEPGPDSVTTAGHADAQGLGTPVLVHLCLGDTFRESLSMMPMDLHSGTAMVLGWDWISSHDLTHLYQHGLVQATSGAAQWQVELLPSSTRQPRAADLGTLIGHTEFQERSPSTRQ